MAVLLLVIVFTIGFGLVFSRAQVDVVKRTWDKRRCEPGVIFAGFMYKPDGDTRSAPAFAADNFNFCMKLLVKSVIDKAMEPVMGQMKDAMGIAGTAHNNVNGIRSTIGNIIGSFSEVISGFMGIYNRAMMQSARVMTHIRMAFNRMFATLTAAFYAGLSSLFAGLNMFQFIIKVIMIILGIMLGLLIVLIFVLFPFFPLIMSVIGFITAAVVIFTGVVSSEVGDMASGFCFSGDTLVQMADGTQKPISTISVGDQLKGGGCVEGTLVFDGSGVDLFNYKGVRVSGEHLVFDTNRWKKVSDTSAIPITDKESRIYSLVTDNNRIQIASSSGEDILFADWEEFTGIDPDMTATWHKYVQDALRVPSNYRGSATGSAHLSETASVYVNDKQVFIKDIKIGDMIRDRSASNTTRVLGIYKCQEESSLPMSQGTWRWAGTYWRQGFTSGFESMNVNGDSRYHLITESGTFTVYVGDDYIIRDFTEMGIAALKKVSGEVAKKISVDNRNED